MTKEAEVEIAQTKKLMIGDIVTFQSVKWIENGDESFLYSEGILKGELKLSGSDSLDDCKFAIHLQRQYSAAREFREFQESQDKIEEEDPIITAKYLQALKRGCINEIQLNNDYMRKKYGKPVLFGDIIQLYHIKSGKYIKIIPGQLASVERENIKVVLSEDGDPYAWLQILPRFKIDRVTDPIPHSTELYLGLSERVGEFLHAADRDSLVGQRREVNCSLEATSWKLNIFQSAADSSDTKRILASDIVYIYDPETRCYLMLGCPPLENLDDNDNDENKDGEDNEQKNEEEEQKTLEADYSIILEPAGSLIDSSALWVIELDTPLRGGPITYKTERVKLKHLNTGKYLAVELIMKELEDGGMEDQYQLTMSDDPDFEGNRLHLTEMNSNSAYLNLGKAIQISRNGLYVERGELDEKTYAVSCGEDNNSAINFVINRYQNMQSITLHHIIIIQ